MNLSEPFGGGSGAEMPQQRLSACAFLDANADSASPGSVISPIGSNEAHPDEDFMLMGGYGAAEVPDGMQSLVGNAARRRTLQPQYQRCPSDPFDPGMFKATVERTAGSSPTVSLKIAGMLPLRKTSGFSLVHVSRKRCRRGRQLE